MEERGLPRQRETTSLSGALRKESPFPA